MIGPLRLPLASLALAAIPAAIAVPPRPGAECEVRWRLVAQERGDWRVTLEAEGLAGGSGPVHVELQDWGEWTEVDAYHLRELESVPPLKLLEGRRDAWEVAAPQGWDGRLRVEYALATTMLGSQAQEAHGLLPWRAPSYTLGFSANVLMNVLGEGLDPEYSLRVEAPAGWTIATGACGVSDGAQECVLPDGYGNGVISLGKPVARARRDGAWTPIEVVQWGGGRPVAEPLADFAAAYVAALSEGVGLPPAGEVRLFVTEPGMGGTRTSGSIALGCPETIDGRRDPYTAHFLAHEMAHEWLGGLARGPGESMAWFWEGFTEYLSLLHLAKAGLVPREWFASRVGDWREEAQRFEGWKDIAFADASVDWREEATEKLAYSGSALVAFALDVALRRDGREGLVELLRDLCERGSYDLDVLRAWLEAHGQARFWSDRIAGVQRPDTDADLAFAGFERRDVDVPLTYLGIRIEPEGGAGKVVAIDPEGPAAGCGLALGDEVRGRAPRRVESVRVGAQVQTRFRYGLELYDPNAASCEVHVLRGGEELMFQVAPRAMPGGLESKLVALPERQDAFFGPERR